jgi:L-alanine-DL-glutamate epimerase-like enolase superfamily enzyme
VERLGRLLQQLRDKINTYAQFAPDEGMVAAYPESAGQPLRFQLDCVSPPTEEVTRLIETARQRLGDYKIRFTVHVQQRQDDYGL